MAALVESNVALQNTCEDSDDSFIEKNSNQTDSEDEFKMRVETGDESEGSASTTSDTEDTEQDPDKTLLHINKNNIVSGKRVRKPAVRYWDEYVINGGPRNKRGKKTWYCAQTEAETKGEEQAALEDDVDSVAIESGASSFDDASDCSTEAEGI